MPLLLILVAGLLTETWLLIEVGAHIGGLATIGICVATGFVGGNIARHQGLSTLANANRRMRRGEIPTREMADGLLILLAGVVLLTPGYLSDAAGMLLLFPPVRAIFRQRLGRWARRHVVMAGQGPTAPWQDVDVGRSPIDEPVEILPPEDRPRPFSERRDSVKIIDG